MIKNDKDSLLSKWKIQNFINNSMKNLKINIFPLSYCKNNQRELQ